MGQFGSYEEAIEILEKLLATYTHGYDGLYESEGVGLALEKLKEALTNEANKMASNYQTEVEKGNT